MVTLTPSARKIHEKLQGNPRYFAERFHHIKDKDGKVGLIKFNKSQKHLFDCAEDQIRRCGWVRQIVTKGRQQGLSTGIGSRLHHKTSRFRGKSTFILSHEAKTTKVLFDMVKLMHDRCEPAAVPKANYSNQNELIFDSIQSKYTVGTAGNAEVGRGGVLQYFHGSEVASWRNTPDIKMGILESVASRPGTEIFLESTAKGMGGFFYEETLKALKSESEYEVVFCPWFWDDWYERDASELELSKEDREYMEMYLLACNKYPMDETTALRKMAWRQYKIRSFGVDRAWMFKQEYPAHVMEAFEASGDGMFPGHLITKARQNTYKDPKAPLTMGIDPAPKGGRTGFAFCRGVEYPRIWGKNFGDDMAIVGYAAEQIKKHKPQMVFVDRGQGTGVVSRLNELGFDNVVGIEFGGAADDPSVYRNKRAEMYGRLLDAMEDPNANIPDSDELQADLSIIPWWSQGSEKKALPTKAKICADAGGAISPDLSDAAALCKAQLVNPHIISTVQRVGIVTRASQRRSRARA